LRSRATVDVAVGASALVLEVVAVAARGAGSALRPVASVVLRPPVVPRRLHPARLLDVLGREGAERREPLREALSRRLDVLVPAVLAEVLRRAHLTEMVLRYVDLDEVVAGVDLDAAAARLDVEGVVRRVDLDAVARRIDVDAVAARLDLDKVVGRVDVDPVVARVDVDAVAARLDLGRVLDRLDLTSVVLERVDLDALVEAILGRIDLVGLAEEVIDAVDLPEIIRESTGSMASDTVRGARMQGIAADEAVGRAVDRLLLRRGRRATDAPTIPRQNDRTP